MSNVLELAQLPMAGAIVVLGLVAMVGGSIAVMWAIGVFRAESVQGPLRLEPQESAWVLVAILMGGAAAGVLGSLALVPLLPAPEGARDMMANAMLFVLVFVFVLLGNALLRREGTQRLGLSLRRLPLGLLIGVAALLLVLPLVYGAGIVVTLVLHQMGWPEPMPHEVLQRLRERPDPAVVALLAVSAAVLAPLGEELVFRGMLQTILVRLFGTFAKRDRQEADARPGTDGAGDAPAGGGAAAFGGESAKPALAGGEATEQPVVWGDPATLIAPPRGPEQNPSPPMDVPPMDPGVSHAPPQQESAPQGLDYEAPPPPPLPAEVSSGARWLAIVVCSIIFAMAHGELAFVAPLFVLSVAMGYAYERTGNLWIPIGMHAAFNAFQMLLFTQVAPAAG